MPHLDVGDGRIAYESAGCGEPVLFISGLNGRSAFWRQQFDVLSNAFTTLSFDHRGVGGSSGTPPYSVEQWAADAVRLLDHLGFARAHLVGHSTGAAIAQVIASDQPARVISAVLGGTWARPDDRFSKVFRLRREALMGLGPAAFEILGRLLTSAPDEPWPAKRGEPAPQPPRPVTEARLNALLAYDAGERLQRMVCPTLVLAAQDDILVPPRMSQAVAGEIPGARCILLPSGGHVFPRSRPDEYNVLLLDFLNSVGTDAESGRKGA